VETPAINEHLSAVRELHQHTLSLSAVEKGYSEVMVKAVLILVMDKISTEEKDDRDKGISENTVFPEVTEEEYACVQERDLEKGWGGNAQFTKR
jgi:hypothetical protein